jgi:hypothetical protein
VLPVAIDAPDTAAHFYPRRYDALFRLRSESTLVSIRVTVPRSIGVDPLFLDKMVRINDMLVMAVVLG